MYYCISKSASRLYRLTKAWSSDVFGLTRTTWAMPVLSTSQLTLPGDERRFTRIVTTLPV